MSCPDVVDRPTGGGAGKQAALRSDTHGTRSIWLLRKVKKRIPWHFGRAVILLRPEAGSEKTEPVQLKRLERCCGPAGKCTPGTASGKGRKKSVMRRVSREGGHRTAELRGSARQSGVEATRMWHTELPLLPCWPRRLRAHSSAHLVGVSNPCVAHPQSGLFPTCNAVRGTSGLALRLSRRVAAPMLLTAGVAGYGQWR